MRLTTGRLRRLLMQWLARQGGASRQRALALPTTTTNERFLANLDDCQRLAVLGAIYGRSRPYSAPTAAK